MISVQLKKMSLILRCDIFAEKKKGRKSGLFG